MKLPLATAFLVTAITFGVGGHSHSVAQENFCGPVCRYFEIPSTHGDCLIDEVLMVLDEGDADSEGVINLTLQHCDPTQRQPSNTQSPGGGVVLWPEYPLSLRRSDLECLVDHYDIVQWSERRPEGMVRIFSLTRCDAIRARQ